MITMGTDFPALHLFIDNGTSDDCDYAYVASFPNPEALRDHGYTTKDGHRFDVWAQIDGNLVIVGHGQGAPPHETHNASNPHRRGLAPVVFHPQSIYADWDGVRRAANGEEAGR